MKTNPSSQKISEKPIKYKQFIQELQNSSRSSNHDQSLLSQRSFRQSHTSRDNRDVINHQSTQKQSPFKLNLEHNSFKVLNPSGNDKGKQTDSINDKLYTFCDAKITQKSVEIVNTSHSKHNSEQNTFKPIFQNPKYFKTHKQRNQQKENIDFVNKILQKVESGSFEGKVLKTQNSQLSNLEKSTKKSPEPVQLPKMQSESKNVSQSSSHRKIESVKKIFVFSKQPSSRTSHKKPRTQNHASEQKSREQSLRKDEDKSKKQSNQKCSSKKKVVSLNINPLKTSLNQQKSHNRIKLCLDKSHDNQSSQKSFNLQSRSSLVQGKLLSSSLQKMPSLDQSKIQTFCNQGSRHNLLMSSSELSSLNNFFINQPANQAQEIQRLKRLLEECKEKEKKLERQVSGLNQKLKHSTNGEQKKQVEILQKDCMRLTNSYKKMKRLYEAAIKDKEEAQSQIQSVLRQNSDLKECLEFKSDQVNELRNKLAEMASHVEQLQTELQTRSFPSQLSGLSDIIKEKLSQYESEIASLLEENHNLTLLREKLQNYNLTLKQEIQEKDGLIWSLQKQLKDASHLRRSCKDEVGDYRQDLARLNKLCKQLQSKLKLANVHNDYLTKEIVGLKQERKQLVGCVNESVNTSQVMVGSLNENVKLHSFNTLANTITTRNSSICHGSSHNLEQFLQQLNKDKEQHKEVYCSDGNL